MKVYFSDNSNILTHESFLSDVTEGKMIGIFVYVRNE